MWIKGNKVNMTEMVIDWTMVVHTDGEQGYGIFDLRSPRYSGICVVCCIDSDDFEYMRERKLIEFE